MEERNPTLVLEHVNKSFGKFKAVDDLSITARPGRVFGLIGPNGAGKTTTMRMIVNISVPDSGTSSYSVNACRRDFRIGSGTCQKSGDCIRK